MNKLIKICGLIMLLLLLMASNVNQSETEITINKINIEKEELFPSIRNFRLYSVNGELVSLKDYIGKIVILEFWAPWCRYSQEQVNVLSKIQKHYGQKDVEVIAIAIDDMQSANKFIKQHPEINYKNLHGNQYYAQAFNVWGTPTIYVLDKELKIRKKFSGYVDQKTLEKEIKKIKL